MIHCHQQRETKQRCYTFPACAEAEYFRVGYVNIREVWCAWACISYLQDFIPNKINHSESRWEVKNSDGAENYLLLSVWTGMMRTALPDLYIKKMSLGADLMPWRRIFTSSILISIWIKVNRQFQGKHTKINHILILKIHRNNVIPGSED